MTDSPRKRLIKTLEAHTGGEPLRIITEGYPEIHGATILERRAYALEHLDHYRTMLMYEPRGHADMYGAILMHPVRDDSDLGVLFIHNEGYSTMCGHAIIALTKVLVETGQIEMNAPITPVTFDAPAGQIHAHANIVEGDVTHVHFHNVPSFVDELDATVDVPGLGTVRYDLAFGGAYYAYVNAADLDLSLAPDATNELIEKGMMIKRAVMASREITHPVEEDLGFLYGTIFVGAAHDKSNHSRNVCIFAEGEVDRSPTGTGVSGRAAIHHARGELDRETITIESIIGSTFDVKVHEETSFHGKSAIVPEVSGTAFLTGKAEFWIDDRDDLKDGFLFR